MAEPRPYSRDALKRYLLRATAGFSDEALRKFERIRVEPYRAKAHDAQDDGLDEYWVLARDGTNALVFDDDWICVYGAEVLPDETIRTHHLYDHPSLEEAVSDFPGNCRPCV